MAVEKTGPQVYAPVADTGEKYAELARNPSDNKLTFSNNVWRKKLIAMRRDPTIALARLLSLAPFYLAEWTTEATNKAPEGAEAFISNELMENRLHLLEHMVWGTIDWGWSAFERVHGLKEYEGQKRVFVQWYKPILQYNTDILIDPKNGRFAGIRQENPFTGQDVDLLERELLFHAINVEGTNWYGEATMLAAHTPWLHWAEVQDAANRYDKKIAGSHWVIYYPTGSTRVNGEDKDNFDIAKEILAHMEASGSVVIPNDVKSHITQLNDLDKQGRSWGIELITDGGAGATSHLERAKYFDVLKVRAFGFPERAVLEGEHGTKAEAGEHGDFALSMAEMRHQQCVASINKMDVNPLLRVNYGLEAEGSVKLRVSSMRDENRELLTSIYNLVLANPEIGPEEIRQLDLPGIREQLRLPTDPDAPTDTLQNIKKTMEKALSHRNGRGQPLISSN